MIHIDFETYCEIDITQVGMHAYTEHESFDLLMMAYAIDDGEIGIWEKGEPLPGSVMDALRDPFETVGAHNAGFERLCFKNYAIPKLGWPNITLDRWKCTAAMAARLALPRSLDRLAIALDLPTKHGRGKQLINLFSKLQRPTKKSGHDKSWRRTKEDSPEDWQSFKEYCVQDVEVERRVCDKISALAYDEGEDEVWMMDSEINDRGVPIDQELVSTAKGIVEEYFAKLTAEFREITGLNPTQRDKYKDWLDSQGVHIPDLTAKTVDAFLQSIPAGEINRTLEIRRSLARSAVKKLDKMQTAASTDGRVRGSVLYHGATTGRFSGRLIQPHNFMRPTIKNVDQAIEVIQMGDLSALELLYNDPMEVVSSCLRGMIAAPKSKLIVADYSSIEARVLCWLAGQDDAVAQYHKGFDAYKDMAAALNNKDVKDVTSEERRLGKAIILGCGYQMGPRTFMRTCEMQGNPIDKKTAKRAVAAFRRKYRKVSLLWDDLEHAAKKAVETGIEMCDVSSKSKVFFGMEEGYLFMHLPSGRRLSYPRAELVMKKTEYTDIDTEAKESFEKETIRFYGAMGDSVVWGNNHTYGGKLVENAVQAIARDLMVYGMKQAVEAGFPIIGTVHDEIIAEGDAMGDFENIICQLPDWAEGVPLAAEGYIARRYRK